jgi:hypothetical protein
MNESEMLATLRDMFSARLEAGFTAREMVQATGLNQQAALRIIRSLCEKKQIRPVMVQRPTLHGWMRGTAGYQLVEKPDEK